MEMEREEMKKRVCKWDLEEPEIQIDNEDETPKMSVTLHDTNNWMTREKSGKKIETKSNWTGWKRYKQSTNKQNCHGAQ